jgi:peptidoglycan/LPS O-acetylase OafA/YrhL
MLRIIAGIIVGFLVMAVLVMATFGITMAVLGMENILKPGAYWTTDTFNIIALIGGLLAAIIGGMVCKVIARDSRATIALAAIVLALGAISAVANMNRPDPPARTGTPTITDLQTHGKEPTWFAISKTVLAIAGLLIGSSLITGRRISSP